MAFKKKTLLALASVAALTMPLAACGGDSNDGGTDTSNASGSISYWLWDANQLPAYEACAVKFEETSKIKVNITQMGWDDYWGKLTNGFVAGTAPDVFTNHLSRYPEFLAQDQLVPLDETLKKDNVDTSIYQPGLAELWVGQDGKRYGLPKDFDTVGLFYNKTIIQEAGITEDQLKTMAWNPTDGGTYEKIIAHLTVDANGKRGDEAGFDKTKVKIYGLGLDGGGGGGVGQTQWSFYTGTTDWSVTDKNPWGSKYNYDDERFQSTIKWWKSLIDKGYMPTLAAVTGQSSADIFAAGKYALTPQGSWMTNTFFGNDKVKVGLAPTPIGPNGKRSSMYNGLADSVWAGSKNQAAAIKWVEFLGSATCQDIVGEKAIVFPAIPSSTAKAEAAWKAKGVDVSAFTVHVADKTTFLFPITDNASKVTAIMEPAMDAVLTGKAEVSSFVEANKQVNALFS